MLMIVLITKMHQITKHFLPKTHQFAEQCVVFCLEQGHTDQ